MGRRAATFLLVVLVALAGCSLLAGDPTLQDGTPTVDDDSTPTATSTPTSTPAFSYPAGYSEAGVENVSRAIERHQAALADAAGFRLVYRAEIEGDQRSSVVTYDVRAEPAAERGLVRFDVTSGDVDGHYSQFYANGTMYVKSLQPGAENATYSNVSRAYSVEQFTGGTWPIAPVLENVTFGSSGVVTRDGDRVVEYTDGRLRDGGRLPTGRLRSGNVSNFSASMVVGPDGRVRTLAYRATVVDDGAERRLSVSIRVTDVGETSVERPEWVDRA